MTDPIEVGALPPEIPKTRRKRRAAPKVEHASPAPATIPPPSGGLVGLWRALTGQPGGVSVKGDTGLTAAFIVSLLVGTVLCLIGHTSVPLAQQIGFAGPLLATLAYPLWGCWLGAATRPTLRERLADNSYYLGFIFTQIALLVGFLPAAFGVRELSAEQIIRYFGIALGASLIGLIARTILIQMSYSVDEAADVVSGEVSALAQRVSEQSELVLEQFEQLVHRLSSAQSLMTSEIQTSMKALTENVDAYSQTVKVQAESLTSNLSLASASAKEANSVVVDQQESLASAISAVTAVIGELSAQLKSSVHAATANIESTATTLNQGVSVMKGIQELGHSLAAVESRIDSFRGSIETLDEKVASAGTVTDAALDRMKSEIERATGEGMERAESIRRQTEAAIGSLEKTLMGFREELDRLRD